MFQLVYLSSASQPFSEDDLVALLTQARQNNTAHGLTGMLLYKDGNFMQVLEGDEAEVRRLFHTIEQTRATTAPPCCWRNPSRSAPLPTGRWDSAT